MTQAVATFSDKTLRFLSSLATNNSKTWFDAHRSAHEQHLLAPAKAFVEDMGEALRELAPDVHAEPRLNGSIFRINRDWRTRSITSCATARTSWMGTSTGTATTALGTTAMTR